MRAGIAFGSNLGDRLRLLRQARACLLACPLLAPPVLASRIYLTTPVDCPPGSDSFFNAVLEAELTGAPGDLLRAMSACEEALGRAEERTARNAPRSIDLDLLYAGDCAQSIGPLILPHPRMAQRRFVLAPLADIRPGLVLPGQHRTIAELLDALPPGDLAEPISEPW
ncbi:MAG TPA: 2-amino-4-hydroxy-6-hydroxymethyldihydropteridine diphosphokinase [Chthoniobacteraceae bacterium]|jgi:2-amino-4-hydroxy-6-hydroxymethyldihydropteridine diphosphokinase|nr:2-amino-4-hydroxy-6-hydroxymethyldihydropteridine diphosphokinase [Chthoniobacteraceae bacterium]